VIVFFAWDRRGESLWSAVIAPALSAAALVAMVWLVVDNYATLLGVAPARRWPGSSPLSSPSPQRQA
jgi:hypothetical protein